MQVDQFDIDYIIARMQDAVDVVNSSEHETSKVAACLFDASGKTHNRIVRTNHRPAPFKKLFTPYERIGKSSQFVHAEAACILEYPYSPLEHYLCVTDPFCPNCAKTIIESGVSRVFIDHKGMDKDYVRRRAGAFNLISLKMAQAAGIDVYILYRKERRFEPLVLAKDFKRPEIKGITVHELESNIHINSETSLSALREYLTIFAENSAKDDFDTPRVFCYVSAKEDSSISILEVRETLPPGLHENDIRHVHPEDTDKYRFAVDAMNKLYFTLKRLDMKPLGGLVYCNHIPSSRAFVNAMLSDVKDIIICPQAPSHDSYAYDVSMMMRDNGFMDIHMGI